MSCKNIICLGTCRINTTIEYANIESNITISKFILTSSNQAKLWFDYNLDKIKNKNDYNNIKNSLPYLKKKHNLTEIDIKNSIVFLEISTSKNWFFNNLLIPHDYHIVDVDVDKKFVGEEILTTKEEEKIISENLNYMKNLCKKIIVITHIGFENLENNSRNKLIFSVENICKKHDITCINPTKYINSNRNKYLNDNCHYSEEGYKLMGKVFSSKI